MSPVVILDHCAGPYIVYMLQEIDILEDWAAIKKVGSLLRFPMLLAHMVTTPVSEGSWAVFCLPLSNVCLSLVPQLCHSL